MRMNLLLIMFFISTTAFSGHEGGGGDVVILPDDSVVLADPWIAGNELQPNNMPPLRSINARILQLAKQYLDITKTVFLELSPDDKSEIREELLRLTSRTSGLKFYAVQNQNELNDFCASGGKKTYKLPDGHVVTQVACTAGNDTYLVEPLFLRLSLKDQVLLLFHERLTTFRDIYGGKNYSAIARITTGLNLYLELYKKEVKGVYPSLAVDEAQKLSNLYTGIEEVQYRNLDPDLESFQWIAHPNGGGRVHALADVDPSATVSLTAKVAKGAVVGAKSTIIRTYLRKDTSVGQNSLVKDSYLYGDIKIKDNNHITNSLFIGNLNLGSGLKISDSTIGQSSLPRNSAFHGNVTMNDNNHITDSKLIGNLNLGSGLKILKSNIEADSRAKLSMDDNSQVTEGVIEINENLNIGPNQSLNKGIITTSNINKFHPTTQELKILNLKWVDNYEIFFKKQNEFKNATQLERHISSLSNKVMKYFASVRNGTFFQNGFFAKVSYELTLNPRMNEKNGIFVVEDGVISKAGYERYCFVPFSNVSKIDGSIMSKLNEKGIPYWIKPEGITLGCIE